MPGVEELKVSILAEGLRVLLITSMYLGEVTYRGDLIQPEMELIP